MLGLIDSEVLTNIANSIREKTGKTEQMTPTDMPTEISSIQVGGGGGLKGYSVFTNMSTSYDKLVYIKSDGTTSFYDGDIYSTEENVAFVCMVLDFMKDGGTYQYTIDGFYEVIINTSAAFNQVHFAVYKILGNCTLNKEEGGGAAPNL